MIHLIEVAHVTLNVTDLDRSVQFYKDMLGMRVSGERPGVIVWMNIGQFRDGDNLAFHNLGLYKVPAGATEDYRKRAGMNHAAFRLRTAVELDKAAELLRAKGVKVLKGPLTHSEDQDRYLYFEDPDGNVIELVASTLPGYPQEYLRQERRTGGA
jgi:catechol 2,3-dioxygenase-like lactoylglutathione lyase family enzyme